jgi:ribosome-dependent ATPase
MHQGKVLACDTPKALTESQQKNTLEEAFISYLEAASEESKNTKEDKEPIYTQEKRKSNRFFSPLRLFGYSHRESLELIRDPVRLVFALFGTALLMLILGFGIALDTENLPFAVLDQDNTPQSRNYAQNISGSKYFIERPAIYSFDEAQTRMREGELSIVIIIPPNFGENIKRARPTEISAWIDGAMPFRAETIRGYIQGMHYKYIGRLAKEEFGYTPKPTANIEVRYRYNQDFKSINAMVPAVVPMLLMFIPSILMALSVVREKELGSITNFYATPVTRFEFLIGKQIPYIAVSMVGFVLLLLIAKFVFGIYPKGNIVFFALSALVYVTITTGLGFLISSFTKTQIAALAGTAVLTLLPTINFSGMKDPVSSLEGVAAWIGTVFPATYFINISRGVFSKALGFEELYIDFSALCASVVVITMISILLLKKQDG